MSSLAGGSASEGTSRVGNGRGVSSTQGSAPTSQQPQTTTSRLLTPRDVMNQRAAREARRRAEEEETGRAEQQRRIDIQRRQSAERRAAAAAAQTREPGYRPVQSSSERGPSSTYDASQANPAFVSAADPSVSNYPMQLAQEGTSAPQTSSRTTRAPPPPSQPSQNQATYTQTSQPQQQFEPSSQSGRTPQPQQAQQQQQSSQTQPEPDARANISSFPHAFERWETLSSHWEGLTGYWIRKLEMNTETIRRENDITREQMSRQITDLAAAGANLFHAVVELQRLRASSERKFQRWFFETRSRQERDEEELQRLRNEIEAEREERAANVAPAALQAEMDRRFAEMRRELQISKDEARRAWEELGRREQEERERQLALREGHPIFVGGVQVLPMSAVSRGGSVQQRPQTRDPTLESSQVESGDRAEYELQEPSPTLTDPFTSQESQTGQSSQRVQTGTVPILPPGAQPMTTMSSTQQGQMSSTAGFYQQPGVFLHDPVPAQSMPRDPRSVFSEEGSDDGLEGLDTEALGNIQYDVQGRPIATRLPPSTSATMSLPVSMPTGTQAGLRGGATIRSVPPDTDPETGNSDDEYDVVADLAMEQEQTARYVLQEQQAGRLAGTQIRTQPSPADYEGEGFGSGTGWTEAMPRHQHPTRLSDVLEEDDERSRHSLASGGGPTATQP